MIRAFRPKLIVISDQLCYCMELRNSATNSLYCCYRNHALKHQKFSKMQYGIKLKS